MAERKRTCKICGKEYIPCRSLRNVDSLYNWRKVACSPKCGEEYFRQIAESRKEPGTEDNTVIENSAFDESAEIETIFDY